MANDSDGDHGAWQPVLKADDAAGAEALLAGGADPLARAPPFGWTPLHNAAGYGAVECCKVLLKAKADPGEKAEDGETPLHLAAQDGKEHAIRLLAEARAQVDAKSADGETPLHVAVQHVGGKDLDHVKALIELRADTSICDAEGRDVHTMARLMTNRADELADVLGGNRASTGAAGAAQPERTAAELEQVLRVACRRGQVGVVRELLARMPAQAVPAAAARSLVAAAAGGSVESAEALLAARADVHTAPTDERGTGPLVAAADEGAVKMVRWLLAHSANPNAASMDGATALMAASGRGAADCARELLAARAAPDARAVGGWTALMAAARGGRAEVAKVLLDAKAQVDIVAEDGSSARKLAMDTSGRGELVKILDARQRLNARRAKAEAGAEGAAAREEDTRNIDDLLVDLGEAPKKKGSKTGKKAAPKSSAEAAKAPPPPVPAGVGGADAAGQGAAKAAARAEPAPAAAKSKAAKAPAAEAPGKAGAKASRAKAIEARLREIAAQRADLDAEEKALRQELTSL